MNEQQRREATITVLGWLAETCGEDVAEAWTWAHTPMPCGLPLDAHLEEALHWAAIGREAALPLMTAAREAIERRMEEAMASRHVANAAESAVAP